MTMLSPESCAQVKQALAAAGAPTTRLALSYDGEIAALEKCVASSGLFCLPQGRREVGEGVGRQSTLLSFFSNGDRQQDAPQSDGILEQLKDEMWAGLVEAQKAEEDRAGLLVVEKKEIATLTATIQAETKGSRAADLELAASSRRVAAARRVEWGTPEG